MFVLGDGASEHEVPLLPAFVGCYVHVALLYCDKVDIALCFDLFDVFLLFVGSAVELHGGLVICLLDQVPESRDILILSLASIE